MIVFQAKHIHLAQQVIIKARGSIQTRWHYQFDGSPFSCKYYFLGKYHHPLVAVIFEWYLSGVNPVFLGGEPGPDSIKWNEGYKLGSQQNL